MPQKFPLNVARLGVGGFTGRLGISTGSSPADSLVGPIQQPSFPLSQVLLCWLFTSSFSTMLEPSTTFSLDDELYLAFTHKHDEAPIRKRLRKPLNSTPTHKRDRSPIRKRLPSVRRPVAWDSDSDSESGFDLDSDSDSDSDLDDSDSNSDSWIEQDMSEDDMSESEDDLSESTEHEQEHDSVAASLGRDFDALLANPKLTAGPKALTALWRSHPFFCKVKRTYLESCWSCGAESPSQVLTPQSLEQLVYRLAAGKTLPSVTDSTARQAKCWACRRSRLLSMAITDLADGKCHVGACCGQKVSSVVAFLRALDLVIRSLKQEDQTDLALARHKVFKSLRRLQEVRAKLWAQYK